VPLAVTVAVLAAVAAVAYACMPRAVDPPRDRPSGKPFQEALA
jgi:hypothetical protein